MYPPPMPPKAGWVGEGDRGRKPEHVGGRPAGGGDAGGRQAGGGGAGGAEAHPAGTQPGFCLVQLFFILFFFFSIFSPIPNTDKNRWPLGCKFLGNSESDPRNKF